MVWVCCDGDAVLVGLFDLPVPMREAWH